MKKMSRWIAFFGRNAMGAAKIIVLSLLIVTLEYGAAKAQLPADTSSASNLSEPTSEAEEHYLINRTIYRSHNLRIVLAAVHRRPSYPYLNFDIIYLNLSDTPIVLECSAGAEAYLIYDGQSVQPTSDYCNNHLGEQFVIEAGEALASFAVFINILGQDNGPFALQWYGNFVSDVALRRPRPQGLDQTRPALSFFDMLIALGVGGNCISQVVTFTGIGGYPFGTIVGLSSLECAQFVAETYADEGMTLARCMIAYRRNPSVCFPQL